MNIDIRKASLEDLESVQELNNKMFELEYKHFDNTLNVGWTYEKAGSDYLKNMIENQIVYLAIINDEIVGYLAGKVGYTKSKLAELDNMFVTQEYRKYGIGAKLLDEFKKHCLTNGMDNIKVTAFAKNKNAIAFYIKNGFEEWDITLKCKL